MKTPICATCLVRRLKADYQDTLTIYKGDALCEEHLIEILNIEKKVDSNEVEK